MCNQNVRQYICGCLKQERFQQCEALVGIPYRCLNITRVTIGHAPYPCATHLMPVDLRAVATLAAAARNEYKPEDEEGAVAVGEQKNSHKK